MNKTYWTTRDGRMVDVDNMDCQHLRNALKMIIRNNQKEEKKKNKFTLHGDMANEFNESQRIVEYEYPEEDERFDDIADMLDETWNNGEFYK